ncbi:MAG: M23 family metallopeptidase [Deltaproteobacteria bacterium]|nr:M23 family metallopeptidase [Deltaproteobacteria bacterium]
MDEISLALNPPHFIKSRRGKRPIQIARSASPVWPLPAVNEREPVILPSNDNRPGIELAYARTTADDALDAFPAGSESGTTTHFTPQMTTVHSFHDGVITFAGRLGQAYGVIINHGNGWATHYANLKAVCAIRTDLYSPEEQCVRAGDVIGYVGAPAKGDFKRLYFELWEADSHKHFIPVDPRPQLASSRLLRHYDRFTPAPSQAQKAA